jgi:ParB-like chromosome segregation protein Spo0J
MPDDATNPAAQAQAVGDELLRELETAVAASQDSIAAARARIAHIAEEYWARRRQMEEMIAARSASATEAADRAAAHDERIAQLKKEIGA